MPAMGYYDERDPRVTVGRLAQMEIGKVDCAAYQLEWAHEHSQPGKLPAWRPRLDSPLINSHCADNHPASSPVKFFVSWWDTSAGDPLWQEMAENIRHANDDDATPARPEKLPRVDDEATLNELRKESMSALGQLVESLSVERRDYGGSLGS